MASVRVTYEDGVYPFHGSYDLDGITITERAETLKELLRDLEEKVNEARAAGFVKGEIEVEVDW